VAVREAVARLEVMLLERAMNGSVKTVTKAGGATETVHEYPNTLALQLLRMHRETAAEAETPDEGGEEEIEAVRRRVLAKLAAVRRRLGLPDDEEEGAEGDGTGEAGAGETGAA
jgi:hypothetical protein